MQSSVHPDASKPQPTPMSPEITGTGTSQYNIGEIVASVKQLALRPYFNLYDPDESSQLVTVQAPWVITPYLYTSSTGLNTPPNPSYINNLAASFAYFVGSYSADLVSYDKSAVLWATLQEAIPHDGYEAGIGSTVIPPSSQQPLLLESGGKALHFRVPMYSVLRSIPCCFTGNDYTFLEQLGQPVPPVVCFGANNSSGVASQTYYGKKLADDSRYFRYLGPPPCYFGISSTYPLSPMNTYLKAMSGSTPVLPV